MREIRFRGWSAYKERWIIGSLVNNLWCSSELTEHPGRLCMEIITTEVDDYDGDGWEDVIDECIFKVEYNSVGQFTGLKDKNGIDIYEGDIVEWFDKGSNYPETMHIIRQVTYSVCSFKDCNSAIYPVEIIGNIHENPELLKQ